MSSIVQFPDRHHSLRLDEVAEKIRELVQYDDRLSYAESIAILEMIKFDIMRDMQNRYGVDEE